MSGDISYTAAVLAGLVSFLSPCVLPLVPPYLCYMAGVSLDRLTGRWPATAVRWRHGRRWCPACASPSCSGFSTVFMALGWGASSVGMLLRQHMDTLAIVAGVAIIAMGLHFLGIFRIGTTLHREARFAAAARGMAGSYVMGLAFAFGWTPCIGPVLGVILALAGSSGTASEGAALAGRLFGRARHSVSRCCAVHHAVHGVPDAVQASPRHHGKGDRRAAGAHRHRLPLPASCRNFRSGCWKTFPALGQLG